MNCPQCSAENPDGAKFCNKCGQSLAAAIISEPVSEPAVTATPVAATAQTIPSSAPSGNNTNIIILIVVLLAIIGAAGAGWYFWNKSKSAPGSSATDSAQASVPGQAGAVAQQPGMPQVDAYGMPVKQAGADGAPAPAATDGAPAQQMPAQDTGGLQPGEKAVQPGTANNGQPQDVMPEPMPNEARKRRAVVETPPPRRHVRASGSIDDQFNQRAAAECPAGGSGFFCREKLRYKLCNGHWSASPPPGQTMCKQVN